MTSSLVGSEMCIRDRPWPCPPHQVQSQVLLLMRQKAAARSGQRRAETVSYTHLTLPTICSV
eukprot:5591949-Prorocentrum_lima.AAC.1